MIKKIKIQTNKTFVNKIDEVLQKIFEKNINTSKQEFTNSPAINNNTLNIAIAVSGGSDSLALFFLLLDFCQNRNIKIHALSVDHKMRTNSSIEVKKLANLLKKYHSNDNFSHNILTLPKNKIPQKNIEAKLRELRYELLGKYCQKNNIKLLFLGHQLNDIAENFLIRLFRGSSIDGLSSLKEISNLNDLKLIVKSDDRFNYQEENSYRMTYICVDDKNNYYHFIIYYAYGHSYQACLIVENTNMRYGFCHNDL